MSEKEKKRNLTKPEKKIRKKVRKRALDHERFIIGSGSEKKVRGMSETYAYASITAESYDLYENGFNEPSLNSVLTVLLKCLATLRILGVDIDVSEHESLNFEPVKKTDIPKLKRRKGKKKGPEHAIIDVMDVTTTVAKYDEVEVSKIEGSNRFSINKTNMIPIEMLKLDRDHPNHKSLTEEEKVTILSDDLQQRMQNEYSGPFVTIFEPSRGIFSSRGDISNIVAQEIVVFYKKIPKEILQEAWMDPDVWGIGPRINLADLLVKHPELVEAVYIRDLHADDETYRQLGEDQYHLVPDFVVYGKVDHKTMKELLKKNREAKWYQKYYPVRSRV